MRIASSVESPGGGFYQMMDGVEVGRVNVGARGCGVAWRARALVSTDDGRRRRPDDGQVPRGGVLLPGGRGLLPRRGGYGYSTEYEIERLYREAPMLLIGEGIADIQRMIIGRRLLEDYKLR